MTDDVTSPTPSGTKALEREPMLAGLVLAATAFFVLWGLPSYGIWDPWELAIADDARHLLAGEPVDATRPPLGPWLVARAFGLFGVHEWSGRLPVALAGLLLAALAVGMGRFFGDLRRGSIAALVVSTSPLFLLNARHMMGTAPAQLASGLVFAAAAGLAFPGRRGSDVRVRVGLALALVVGTFVAASASGILLGVAPPLLAVAAAVVARLPWGARPLALPDDRLARQGRLVQFSVTVLAALVAVATAMVIAANEEGYSVWTGGVPRGQTPPTFELPIEALFHAFAPWSALLPLAVGLVMAAGSTQTTETGDDDESAMRGVDLAAVAWIGLGLAAQSVHAARFGDGAFLPVLGLGWVVASFLRTMERSSGGESWARGLVAVLLVGLLVRDFRSYPGSPVSALALRGFAMPDVFNPSGGWAGTLGLFGLASFFALASDVRATPRTFREAMGGSTLGGAILRAMLPLDLLAAQWARGRGFRAWLVAGAVLVAALLGFGVVALALGIATRDADDESRDWIAANVLRGVQIGSGVALVTGAVAAIALNRGGETEKSRRRVARGLARGLVVLAAGTGIGAGLFALLGANSLAVRVGQALFAVPFAVLVLIGVGRAAYHVLTSLGSRTFWPVFGAALALAAWFVVRFHPQASAHFSPREIYDTYNALAAPSEPLGEYQVGGRAAAYYARGEVVELRGEPDALAFLARPERVWLALPAEQLAQLDRGYRARAGRHLFVADARNARVLLATNQPIEGRADENYLAGFVLDAPPPMQHPVNASFDRRIELLGYDLELPNGDTVGPGQSFVVTWYWRCITPVPGGYQPFLHVDGYGQRLNGDHEPVGGRYPVRMWSEGDVVVDRQELRVPANFPPGDYTFFIGLYAGESRLEVVEGPEDDANRVVAGRLRVR
ncbi:MAG: hypothetical protein OHK0013_39760 [Sandaracinaceae bacterium]